MPSLSAFLGWSIIGLAIAATASVFPATLVQGVRQPLGPLQWAQVIVSGGAVAWLLVAVALLWAARLARGSRLARGTAPLAGGYPAGFPVDPGDIELRLRGDAASIHDHGGSLAATPIAVYALRAGRLKRMVLLPALFWKRFAGHAEELGAVLAHEVAHFRHRDIVLIYSARDFAAMSVLVVALGLALGIVSSAAADAGEGPFELDALRAALIGKSYLVVCLAASAAAIPLIRLLSDWREALADRFAEAACGPAALEGAEALVEGSEGDGGPAPGRPSTAQRHRALSLGPGETFAAALLASALGGYFAGNLIALAAAIAGTVSATGEMPVPEWADAMHTAIAFAAPLFVLMPGALGPEGQRLGLSSIGWRGLIFCAGWTAGWLLTQALPMLLASTAMPQGYDYVVRAYPGPLVLKSTADALSMSAQAVLLATASLWLAVRARRIWPALLPPAAWITASAIEVRFMPQAYGGIALGATVIALAAAFVMDRGGRLAPARAGAPFTLLLLLAAAGWAGLGGYNHVSATMQAAARREAQAKDGAAALRHARQAASYMRFHAAPKIELAEALAAQNDPRGAIHAAEAAAAALYASAWSEVFKAKLIAAELRLAARSAGDLEVAAKHFEDLESMWRMNSRLPREQVAGMLYNQACLGQLTGRPAEFALARLLEAALLDRAMATSALQDEDLRGLRIASTAPPSRDAVEAVSKAGKDAGAWEKAVREGHLSRDQLASVLGALARAPEKR